MTPFTLDPAITYLNHGSFGATPLPVQQVQQAVRTRMEREPVRFFTADLEGLLDQARDRLAAFVGAKSEQLAFVHNATTAVNTVLRSIAPTLKPGDELLGTDHVYGACLNAMRAVAEGAGASVVLAEIPFPIASPSEVIERVMAKVTPRTRWALLDHITSPTALVFPVEPLVKALIERGIDVMVDGAHAPGMLPLAIERLGAAWYTGNLHKWVCAPKGSAFLWARDDRRDAVRPLVLSHPPPPGSRRSRFHHGLDFTGTEDFSPYLSVPAALDTVAGLEPGGWPEVMAKNHALALEASALLQRELSITPGGPDAMLGSMVAFELPAKTAPPPGPDPLHFALFERHQIEVPVYSWFQPGRRLFRISAQRYNQLAQYQRLADAVKSELKR